LTSSDKTFWEVANPLIAIEQVTYLVFMKRLDDLEAKRKLVCRVYPLVRT